LPAPTGTSAPDVDGDGWADLRSSTNAASSAAAVGTKSRSEHFSQTAGVTWEDRRRHDAGGKSRRDRRHFEEALGKRRLEAARSRSRPSSRKYVAARRGPFLSQRLETSVRRAPTERTRTRQTSGANAARHAPHQNGSGRGTRARQLRFRRSARFAFAEVHGAGVFAQDEVDLATVACLYLPIQCPHTGPRPYPAPL